MLGGGGEDVFPLLLHLPSLVAGFGAGLERDPVGGRPGRITPRVAERAATEGQRWGEMRKVGSIPMAEFATMLRQDGTIDNKRSLAWLKKNPAFVTFSKVLK